MSAAYAARPDEKEDFADRSDEEEYEFDDYDAESADDDDHTSQPFEKQSKRSSNTNSGDDEQTDDQQREEYTRTIPSTDVLPSRPTSKVSARSAFSATAPLSAPPSRPLSAQSRSQLVTSAISDEEQSDSDGDSSNGQEEYEQRATAPQPQPLPTSTTRPHTADNHVAKNRPATTANRTSRPATAAASRQAYQPSSLSLRLEASGTIEAVKPLSGAEWRTRLQQMKARIVREGYSRGERLDSGEQEEEEKQQLDFPLDAPNNDRTSSLTSLNQASFARATQPSQQAATSSTARSTASSAPSPHTSLALKWNAYAKDQEGMEQELKSLRRDKRHMLALLDTHAEQLVTTQQKHGRLLARLTSLARQKGMLLVTAPDGRTKAELAGEVGEAGEGEVRLNPLLSMQQVAVSLQREVARLEVERERKECEQDELEEQQRLEEERAAEEDKRERRWNRADDDYSDDGEDDDNQPQRPPRITQRHRLRVLREKKAALLQQVHDLQEQLQRSGGGESGLSRKDQAAMETLIASIATARSHADTYEEQLIQRQRQLETVREENDRLAQLLRSATDSNTKAVKHRSRV